MSKLAMASIVAGVLAGVLVASALRGGGDSPPVAAPHQDNEATVVSHGDGPQSQDEERVTVIGDDQPVFDFEERIARNHLIVVGTVTADLGEREYSRFSFKDSGAQYPGEQTPGVRTALREVRIERIVKGVPSGSGDTIVVEELLFTPSASVGGRYLFLLAPWHLGTYQAGAYGAITQSQAGLQFAGGEAAGEVLPELLSLDLPRATELVARTVERQSVEGAGQLAVPGPFPGRPYDIAHAYSLGAAASMAVDGVQVPGASVRAAAAAAGADIASIQPPASPGASPLTTVTVRYVSGQTASFQVDLGRGLLISTPGDVTVPLPASLRELLSAAR